MRFACSLLFSLFGFSALAQHNLQLQVEPTVSYTIRTGQIRMQVEDTARTQRLNLTTAEGVLLIEAPGFKTVQTRYRTGDAPLRITLQPLLHNLAEVAIEAQRGTGLPGEGTRTVLSSDYIQRQNLGQDIPLLLQQTPSLVATSDAGNGVGYTGLRIRGSDPTRINVTLDGIPVNDAESQGTFWVDLPDLASSVGSIQVQRGVGTSTAGPAAFGASVNVASRLPSDTAGVEVSNSFGSYGTRKHTLLVNTGRLGRGFSATGRLSRLYSDGYVDRATADLASYLVQMQYQTRRFSARLLHTSGRERTYQAWNGIPQELLQSRPRLNLSGTEQQAGPYKDEVDSYRQDYWQLHLAGELGGGWQLSGALWLTQGAGYYEQYKAQQSLATYGLPPVPAPPRRFRPDSLGADSATEATDLVRRRWLRNAYYGATATLRYAQGRHTWTSSLLASQYDGSSFGEIVWARLASASEPGYRYYDSPSRKRELSGWSRYAYATPTGWQLYLDLQLRAIDYRISGLESSSYGPYPVDLSRSFLFLNPKAGASYRLAQGGQVYATFALAHREPTRTSYTDARGGTPSPERLYNVELGWQGRSAGGFSPALNGYWMYYHDQLLQNGQLSDVGSAIMRNVARSYRLGLEAIGTYRYQAWTAQGSVTASINRIAAYTDTVFNAEYTATAPVSFNGTDIAFSPRLIAQASVGYRFGFGLEATLLGRHISRQYLDNTSSAARQLPAYTLADLRLSYEPHLRWPKTLRASVQINNLLSARYASNGYTWYTLSEAPTGGMEEQSNVYVFPQAPVNFLAGVTVGF